MRALHRIGRGQPALPAHADRGRRRRPRRRARRPLRCCSKTPTCPPPTARRRLAPAAPTDPAFLLYTSGTEGPPKGALHSRSYVAANRLQAERWMGVRAGDRVWCTAAAGWSKSLRNVWLAAELCDAETVIHEGRFDAAERLELIAPLAAGRALHVAHRVPHVRPLGGFRATAAAARSARPWRQARRWTPRRSRRGARPTASYVRDGYGQTETGAVAGVCAGEQPRPGRWDGRCPAWRSRSSTASCASRRARLPTLFAGLPGRPGGDRRARSATAGGTPATSAARTSDGLLWYVGRSDDVISSSGYRIGPGEVEAALRSHPAVLEAAAVGLPDPDRGQIVHADVVLRPGVRRRRRQLDEALRLHARAGDRAVQGAAIAAIRVGAAPHRHRQSTALGYPRTARVATMRPW